MYRTASPKPFGSQVVLESQWLSFRDNTITRRKRETGVKDKMKKIPSSLKIHLHLQILRCAVGHYTPQQWYTYGLYYKCLTIVIYYGSGNWQNYKITILANLASAS
jgi:hypothetical protein